ncbi:spore germination protein [Paenibacillus cremeus]|uniref:Spore germination protein n=1 Tax=Paenibacillus cremeus TaxID=2163881 RepID=A0A559KDS3_9BACL|nr:spore germination protein [Paenibacillus cremeus]TVY10259.1 spore germination protein [Paenibacillus cremeus]
MAFVFNIFNIKVNGVTSNGNLDFGNVVQSGHNAYSKIVGGNIAVGDFSPSSSVMVNGVFDPDFSDQGQLANPANEVFNQV